MRALTEAERAAWDRALGDYPFRPLGRDDRFGRPVWPIEEYLARRKHRPTVAERIRRANAAGKVEGEMIRGWYPKGRCARWDRDVMTVPEYIAKCGRDAYRRLPKEAFVKLGGKRRGIRWTAYYDAL